MGIDTSSCPGQMINFCSVQPILIHSLGICIELREVFFYLADRRIWVYQGHVKVFNEYLEGNIKLWNIKVFMNVSLQAYQAILNKSSGNGTKFIVLS